jgi:hypothetical protein
MQRYFILSFCICLIFSFSLSGCSASPGSSSSANKTNNSLKLKLKAVVSTTGNSLKSASVFFKGAPSELNPDDALSFTPSRCMIHIYGIILSESPGSTKKIELPNPNSSVRIDLCSGNALSELLALTGDISASQYGDYQIVSIGFGNGGNSTIIFDAEITNESGYIYHITNLEVGIGYSGIDLKMPTPVTVDSIHTNVVKVIFDLEKLLFLSKKTNSGVSSMTTNVPGYTNTYVSLENFILLPYVGSDNPKVHKFMIRLDHDYPNIETISNWYLKTVVFTDPQSNLVALGAQEVFEKGNYPPPGNTLSAPHFWMPVITKNSNDSWYIDQDPYSTNFNPGGNCVFPAFYLTNHSSILSNRGTEYLYNATEYGTN